MAWTQQDEARYQSDAARLADFMPAPEAPPDPEGAFVHAGKTLANLPGQIVGGVGEGILQLMQMGQPEDVRGHVAIPNLFDVAPDTRPGFTANKAIDVAGGVANQVGQFLLPAGAIGKAGKAIGFGGKLLSAAEWGIPSAIGAAQTERDPGVIATHALTGAAMGPMFDLRAGLAIPGLIATSTAGGAIAGAQKGSAFRGAEEGFVGGLLPAAAKGLVSFFGKTPATTPTGAPTTTAPTPTTTPGTAPSPTTTIIPPAAGSAPTVAAAVSAHVPGTTAPPGTPGGVPLAPGGAAVSPAAATTAAARMAGVGGGGGGGGGGRGSVSGTTTPGGSGTGLILPPPRAGVALRSSAEATLVGLKPGDSIKGPDGDWILAGALHENPHFVKVGPEGHADVRTAQPIFDAENNITPFAQSLLDHHNAQTAPEGGAVGLDPNLFPEPSSSILPPREGPYRPTLTATQANSLNPRAGLTEFGDGDMGLMERPSGSGGMTERANTQGLTEYGQGDQGLMEMPKTVIPSVAENEPQFQLSQDHPFVPAQMETSTPSRPFQLEDGEQPSLSEWSRPAPPEPLGGGGFQLEGAQETTRFQGSPEPTPAPDSAFVDPAQGKLALRPPPPKPLSMGTKMESSNPAMLNTAAKRLNLKYNGVQSGVHPKYGRMTDDLHYFTLTEPGMETTISVKDGASYSELKAAKTQALKEMTDQAGARAAQEGAPTADLAETSKIQPADLPNDLPALPTPKEVAEFAKQNNLTYAFEDPTRIIAGTHHWLFKIGDEVHSFDTRIGESQAQAQKRLQDYVKTLTKPKRAARKAKPLAADFKPEPEAAPVPVAEAQPTSPANAFVPAQIAAESGGTSPSSFETSAPTPAESQETVLNAQIKDLDQRLHRNADTLSRQEKRDLKERIRDLRAKRNALSDEAEVVPAQSTVASAPAPASDDFDADAFLRSLLNDPSLEEASRNASNPLRKTATEEEENLFREGIKAIQELEADPEAMAKVHGSFLKKARNLNGGFVSTEFLLRYMTPSVLGGATGAALNPDNPLKGAAIGATLGATAGHLAPGVFRALMKSGSQMSADVKSAHDLKKNKGISWTEQGAGDANYTSNSIVERFMRGLQKYGTMTDDMRDISGRSNVHLELETLHNAFEGMKANSDGIGPAEAKLTNEFLDAPHTPANETAFLAAMASHPEWAGHAVVSKNTFAQLERVIAGSIPPGATQRAIIKNLGQYMTDAFRIFTDKSYRASATMVQNMVNELKTWDIFPGYGDLALGKVVDQYLGDIYKNRALYEGGRSTEGQTLDNILMKKKRLSLKLKTDLLLHTGARTVDEIVLNNMPLTPELRLKLQAAIRNGEYVTPAFRQALGQFETPLERIAATGLKLINGARTAKLLSFVDGSTMKNGVKLAIDPVDLDSTVASWKAKIVPGMDPKKVKEINKVIYELSHRQQLPKDAGLGILSGKLVPAQVADHLPGMVDGLFGDQTGAVMTGIQEAHRFMKVGATALNPISHIRQIISTPILALLSDTGLGDLKNAVPVVRGLNKLERDRQFRLGILGADFSTAEFGKGAHEMLTGILNRNIMERFLRAPGVKNMIELYHYPDAVLRSATFMAAEKRFLAKGMTAAEAETAAIRHTNRYTMNYENIAHGVKDLRKMPFVNLFLSYQFEISRIIKNLAVDAVKDRNIGAIAKLSLLATVPEILQKMSESSLSDKDQKDWAASKNMSPAYSRPRFKFVTGRDKDGKFHFIDFSPLVPTDDLARTLRSTMSGDWKGVLANNPLFGTDKTPVLNVASEIVTGKDNRTGRDINTPGRALDAARQEFAPSMFGGYEFDQIMRALQPNEAGGIGITRIPSGSKTTLGQEAFVFGTGLRSSTVNPAWQQHSTFAAAQEQMRQERLYLNDTLRSDVTKEVKQRAIQRYQQAAQMIAADARSKMGVSTPGY